MNEGMQQIVHSLEELSAISVQSSNTIETIAAVSEEQSAIIGEIAVSSKKLIKAGRNPGTSCSKIFYLNEERIFRHPFARRSFQYVIYIISFIHKGRSDISNAHGWIIVISVYKIVENSAYPQTFIFQCHALSFPTRSE